MRDKESLQFIEMAKLLAMNELGQMYHAGQHAGDVTLPPYPTSGHVSSLMHRDREQEMLKEREVLDAINKAEAAGNLAAAEAMRARLDEEQRQRAAKTEPEPEPEPERQSKGLGAALSRGSLIKALTDNSAGEEEGSVQNIAGVQVLAGRLWVAIQQFIELGCAVDEQLVLAQGEGTHTSARPAETARADETVLKELAAAVKLAVAGLMDSVRAFCEANVRRAVRESDAAQEGSGCIETMCQLLNTLSAKVAAAGPAGVELAARAAELVQSATATLAELDRFWSDSIQMELPQQQKTPWVDGLETLLQAEMQASKNREQAVLARAQAELQNERNEVKRLRAQLDASANRSAQADKEAAAEAADTAAPLPTSEQSGESQGEAQRDGDPAACAKTRVKFQSPRAG